MQTIIVVALILVGLFLALTLVLTMLVARNLREIAAAVAQANQLVATVEESQGLPPVEPRPERRLSMKEVFSALPALLRRADQLKELKGELKTQRDPVADPGRDA